LAQFHAEGAEKTLRSSANKDPETATVSKGPAFFELRSDHMIFPAEN